MIHNKKIGFTIIEMLVVTAIISIISGFMAVNFRKGGESGKLLRSAQQVAQALRKAQNMAMSSVEFGGSVPVEGYGLRFRIQDLISYILFADTSNNGSCGYFGAGTGINSFELEGGIEMDSLYTYTTAPDTGLVSRTAIQSCFIPPDPKVAINPTGASIGGIIVNIKKTGANCSVSSSDCRNITLNKATGRISIGAGAIKL